MAAIYHPQKGKTKLEC